MPKLSKSRLLKSIPLVGFVLFSAIFLRMALIDFPRDIAGAFAFIPAVLLFLVALRLMRLQTAIVAQCVVIGIWWQFGHGPYLVAIVATLVGLKLGEWIGTQWTSAIDHAKAEETFTTLSVGNVDDTEKTTGTAHQHRT